jgi:hypothetical protein
VKKRIALHPDWTGKLALYMTCESGKSWNRCNSGKLHGKQWIDLELASASEIATADVTH